jgi:hypothetical protein
MKDVLISQTLRRSLADWTDADVAVYYVAVALGVAPDPGAEWDFWGDKKWLFWSANPLGDGLYRILPVLVECGALEVDAQKEKYRWNPNFNWESYGEEKKEA